MIKRKHMSKDERLFYHYEHTKKRMLERHLILINNVDWDMFNESFRRDVIRIISEEKNTAKPKKIGMLMFKGNLLKLVFDINDNVVSTVLPREINYGRSIDR